MNKIDALRILVAAQDDPVLAAWAAVAHEHKVSPMTDISPYEYWEAYQAFFAHGLITSAQFDGIDAKQVFFSGRRPPVQDIMRVLSNLRILPEHHHQEPPMSKTRLPDNPFATNGNGTALAERDRGGLAQRGNGNALPSRQSNAMPLNPFSSPEALPQAKGSIPLEGFSGRKGTLPCRDDSKLPSAGAFRDVDLQIICCGKELEMDVADMHAEGPDSIPGGQISVVDRVLHGTCTKCNREHHHSVGEVVAHDQYR
jgi:hypothetical protein